jgi:hypothetical protein
VRHDVELNVHMFTGLTRQQQTGLTAGLVAGIIGSILVALAVLVFRQRRHGKAPHVNAYSHGSINGNAAAAVTHTSVPIAATNFTASNTYWDHHDTAAHAKGEQAAARSSA